MRGGTEEQCEDRVRTARAPDDWGQPYTRARCAGKWGRRLAAVVFQSTPAGSVGAGVDHALSNDVLNLLICGAAALPAQVRARWV
jgi:hypothetical protein